MDTIAKVATAMQTVLTTTADQAARATGCVQRVREFTGATFVQTLVFGWLDDPDASLAQLCQVAATRGVTITPQGLAPRFTEQAAACLQQVLEAALRVVIASEPAALPLLDRFAAVVVHDSTIVCLPDALAERWPGGGGGSATGAGTQAALKLQVGLNLRDGTMPHFSLHPGRVQDQAAAPDPAARRRELVEQYEDLFASPYQAASRGYVDDVIEPRRTRPWLIRALALARSKRVATSARKHGNIPL